MADAQIDITAEVCPITWVRVKLALEDLPTGAVLVVRLRGSEPLRNVPRSAAEEGHEVVSLAEDESGVAVLVLRANHAGRAG